MIELQGLTKTYAGKIVVDDISLRVERGEFGVLIGPSGCGKSTTLRMTNQLIPLSRGRILLGDEDVSRLKPEQLRRRMGYAIQSIGLFPHWTVAENIAVVPNLLKWPRARVDARIDELMNLFHLEAGEYRDKYPHQLSGGQAQRVGVARALAADPEVLLMDEPFGAVDPLTREVLQNEMLRVHAQTRKTIVFVTHDMDEALKLASKVAILNQGRLVQYDRPIELLVDPANGFVSDFIGKADLGLKLLSRRWVGQYLQPLSQPLSQPLREDAHGGDAHDDDGARHSWQVDAEGRPLALRGGRFGVEREAQTAVTNEWIATPEMTMKEALSRMAWFRVRVLPVVDEAGKLVGEVTMEGVMGRQP